MVASSDDLCSLDKLLAEAGESPEEVAFEFVELSDVS